MLIDSVIYCGEKDLYYQRLEYLSPVVDKFIVIESKTYHNGKPRNDVSFEEDFNNHPLRDRIIYRLIDCNDCFNYPEYQNYNGGVNLARENYQRNYVKTILEELSPFDRSDKIIIADVDEIPNIDVLREIKERSIISNQKPFAFLGMQMYYYNHLCLMKGNNFFQTIISHVNYILTCNNISKEIRKSYHNNVFIHNAGWHLSYFMPTDKIIDKINHFLHDNWYSDNKYKDSNFINDCIKNKQSLFANRGDELETISECTIPKIFLQFENFGNDN